MVLEQIALKETLASFVAMAKSKGKAIVVTGPQKLQTLEDNVREVG